MNDETTDEGVVVESDDDDLISYIDQKPALISRMEIRGLFGRYNYNIQVPKEARSERLLLFYADNGRGKTTVLRLLWHLLSPAENRSHRTNISKIVFKSVLTRLSDGTEIFISRPAPTDGPYTLRLSRGGQVVSESEWPDPGSTDRFEGWDLEMVREQMVNWPDEMQREATAYLVRNAYVGYLKELQARPYFLADDRNIYSDELDPNLRSKRLSARDLHARDYAAMLEGRQSAGSPESTQGLVAQELEYSMGRANEMLRHMTVGATATGSASANSVYLDVLRQLGGSTVKREENRAETLPAVRKQIKALGRRSRAFEALGLVPSFRSDDFVEALTVVADDRASIAEDVLDPFVASLSARLDALQDAQSLIQTFLDQTNGFLVDKELTFSPGRGLRIKLKPGPMMLGTSQLSSGERQVVLLLCNALLGRRGTRLFLIDEPELSLNAKWQRKIVPALLACTSGTSVQFLIATHSLELLSNYRSNVVTLTEIDVES